jgi:hypothetical protein
LAQHNSFEARFIPEADKAGFIARLQAHCTAFVCMVIALKVAEYRVSIFYQWTLCRMV